MYKNLDTALRNIKKGVPFESKHFDGLRNNFRLVMEAVRLDGINIFYAGEESRDNSDILLVAVKNEPTALWCASERLKDDKKIVLQAVKRDGCALKFASDRLKGDYEVVLAACKNDFGAFFSASTALQVAYDKYHSGNVVELLEDIIFIENQGIVFQENMNIAAIKEKIALNNSLKNSFSNSETVVKTRQSKI